MNEQKPFRRRRPPQSNIRQDKNITYFKNKKLIVQVILHLVIVPIIVFLSFTTIHDEYLIRKRIAQNERIYNSAINIINSSTLSTIYYYGMEHEADELHSIEEISALLDQLPDDFTKNGKSAKEMADNIREKLNSPMLGEWRCRAESITGRSYIFELNVYLVVDTRMDKKEERIVAYLDCSNYVYDEDGTFMFSTDDDHLSMGLLRLEDDILIRTDRADLRTEYRYHRVE